MKTAKIAIALTALIAVAVATIGLSFAHYANTPIAYTPSQVQNGVDNDWWVRMRSYMQARWIGIEDEEWFDDMNKYMEEHWKEVQNQEWFNQMLEYMEEHGYYHNYGPSNYGDNYYYGPRGYGGRGFGCMGW